MSTYTIMKNKQIPNLLTPSHTFNTEEFIAEHNDLYLTTEFVDLGYGQFRTCYRLHARQPHNIEMALEYDIKCPRCNSQRYMKQVGRCLNSHDLGRMNVFLAPKSAVDKEDNENE